MAPNAKPWLSPKVVTVKREPNVFAAMCCSVVKICATWVAPQIDFVETLLSGLSDTSIKQKQFG
jgi:hypothetical protein